MREGSGKTRELLLDVAEQVVAAKGILGFHLKDLSEPLNIKVPAIYKHFKSRDDVLLALSYRFVEKLAQQFVFSDDSIGVSLAQVISDYIDFRIDHPAYVRLSLNDFATPSGGNEYVKEAAGGDFSENMTSGPLAPMHQRIHDFVTEGQKRGIIRNIQSVDLYRVINAQVTYMLVFPNDRLLRKGEASKDKIADIKEHVQDLVFRYLRVSEKSDSPLRVKCEQSFHTQISCEQ